MLLLVDDRDDVPDVVAFCKPAGHQVHGVIARCGDKSIGTVDPRVFEHRFVCRVPDDRKDIVVLQDIACTFFVLVDHHHRITGVDSDRGQAPADAAQADDDRIHPSGFNPQH